MSGRKRVPWIERYEELKKYKKKHGHCNVPQRYGPLGNWVVRQRTYYRLLKDGKSSRVSDEHMHKLESIGFQWSPRWDGDTVQWDGRFQELKKYKETQGHCNVPHGYGPLGSWVHSQRTNNRLLKEGKPSYMSDEHIHKLESIGFQWSPRWDGDTVQWDARYQELKKYKKTHGHCNVTSTHGSLYNWVHHQRTNYRLLKEGKPARMSDDRIHKLESIGFQWSIYQRRDSDATMQLTTNNTPPGAKSGHKYSLRSTSSAATDAQSCLAGGLEENQTNDRVVASPVISCEEHIADSSKSTRDEAPEFRPFLLGTGYC